MIRFIIGMVLAMGAVGGFESSMETSLVSSAIWALVAGSGLVIAYHGVASKQR